MARPRKAPARLNDMDKETIAKNFLEEAPDCIHPEDKVVIAKEIPKYERIIFINNRDPGTAIYFHYASATHPLKHYTLMHGLEYNLPVEIINHLEGQTPHDPYTCHERIYSERKNYEGLPENYVSGYKPYYQCRTVRK